MHHLSHTTTYPKKIVVPDVSLQCILLALIQTSLFLVFYKDKYVFSFHISLFTLTSSLQQLFLNVCYIPAFLFYSFPLVSSSAVSSSPPVSNLSFLPSSSLTTINSILPLLPAPLSHSLPLPSLLSLSLIHENFLGNLNFSPRRTTKRAKSGEI